MMASSAPCGCSLAKPKRAGSTSPSNPKHRPAVACWTSTRIPPTTRASTWSVAPAGGVAEPAYAIEGPSWNGRVVATGRDTRDAYALVELSTLSGDLHAHAEQEEAFYVLAGSLIVEADGAATTLTPGDFVLV